MINLITRISVIGISVTTAALVILLSAFNGIESMIEKLYSEFDTDIVIRYKHGKTFDENQIDLASIKKVDGVSEVSRAVEEIVVLKKEKKWVNARIIGVDSSYLKMANVSNHMVDGEPYIQQQKVPMGIIGATLLDKLEGYIPEHSYETLLIYAPKREAKAKITSNPFNTERIMIAGRMNYNKEVNSEALLLPITFSQKLLDYKNDITAIYVDVDEGLSNEAIKQSISSVIGGDFEVKTNYEKNELIYKTSKSEKVIVIVILIFIFILSAFNLVASLTMLIIEKMDNIKTLESMGASEKIIFNVFFYEGMLIVGKGILIGLGIGYLVCLLQLFGGLLEMPNSNGELFPVKLKLSDAFLIPFLVLSLSFIASYLPVKYLLKKNYGKDSFEN